jgi:hypothetical protein
MFYTGMTVYKNIPDSAVIQDLQVRGYRVMINDDGRLAAEVKNLQGVVYREFR